jgi:chromosomal replication initiator protein
MPISLNGPLSKKLAASVAMPVVWVPVVDMTAAPTLSDAVEALEQIIRPEIQQVVGPPTLDNVIRAVCNEFQIKRANLVSESRARRLARARQVAMYLATELAARSSTQIGRRLGGRDHTTVLHGVAKIRDLIETDADLAATVDRIRGAFEPQSKQ